MTKKQEVMVPRELVEKATGLDREARRLWGEMDQHLTAAEIISIPFGKVCQEMKDLDLHKFVKKSGSRKGYPEFAEWIQSVTNGKLSKSSLYMAMGLHKLTEGPNAIPAEEVVQMPKENAYRLSTLEPEQRTPDLVEAAKKTPKEKFPKRVQEKLNEGKAEADQVTVRLDFFRKLHPDVYNKLEETIERFTHLPIVRDGNEAMTLQEKSILAICFAACRDCHDILELIEKKHEAEKAAAPDLPETEHEADSQVAIETEPEAVEEEPVEEEHASAEYDEEREIVRETEYVPFEEAEASSEL
jgi:hypothetical protein